MQPPAHSRDSPGADRPHEFLVKLLRRLGQGCGAAQLGLAQLQLIAHRGGEHGKLRARPDLAVIGRGATRPAELSPELVDGGGDARDAEARRERRDLGAEDTPPLF
jgi:hypothetical protein